MLTVQPTTTPKVNLNSLLQDRDGRLSGEQLGNKERTDDLQKQASSDESQLSSTVTTATATTNETHGQICHIEPNSSSDNNATTTDSGLANGDFAVSEDDEYVQPSEAWKSKRLVANTGERGNISSPSSVGQVVNSVVGYARSRLFRNTNEVLMPQPADDTEVTKSNEASPLPHHQQRHLSGPTVTTKTHQPFSASSALLHPQISTLNEDQNNRPIPAHRTLPVKPIGCNSPGSRSLDHRQRASKRASTTTTIDPTQSPRQSGASREGADTGNDQTNNQSQRHQKQRSCSLASSCISNENNDSEWASNSINGHGLDSKRGHCAENNNHWQLFAVTLHRANPGGFGIAISGGIDNSHCLTGDASIVISDVVSNGPAYGLLYVTDRVISVNGYQLEGADYGSAIGIMKEAQQLNMVVKRRVPVPFVEFEQRTLKFTLSKSRKKDDFGIVLGCKFYIKEILNPKLAEKDPGLKEGDTVLRINGQTLEGVTLEEAGRLLQRSREKLSLVVQRDVRRGTASAAGSRWPSQNTVYERLGSVTATPRQSPVPIHYTHSAANSMVSGITDSSGGFPVQQKGCHRKLSSADCSPSMKHRFSDPTTNQLNYVPSSPMVQHHLQNHQNYHSSQQHSAYGQQPQNVVYNNGRMMTDSQQLPPQQPRFNYQQNPVAGPNYPPQSGTPSSVSLSSAATPGNRTASNGSPAVFSVLAGLAHAGNYGGIYYNEQQFAQEQRFAGQQSHHPPEIHSISFHKGNSGLGIRVIGGNQVGIFVSAVQSESPAALNDIRVGDRLHSVNGFLMNGVTREEAIEYLLTLGEEVTLGVERCLDEYNQVKSGQYSDSFYIRTHFVHQKRSPPAVIMGLREMSFQPGDIFHVTDTLCGGSPGYWAVTKVYSAMESENCKTGANAQDSEATNIGIIPHTKVADILAKQSRTSAAMDTSTLSRSIFRKKPPQPSRKSKQPSDDDLITGNGNIADLPLPAYERVALKKPAFHRPVVLFGPLADVARQLLLANFGLRFGAPVQSPGLISSPSPDDQRSAVDQDQRSVVIRLSAVDAVMAAQKHCVLCVSPGSVERLQLAQYAPIVVLIDVDSKSRIRELRSKAGVTTPSARKLAEAALKVKKMHSHLLTATLDASKEDSWFEALRHLIFHLQERRVWMPEFQPDQPVEDLCLFPMANSTSMDSDSLKGDYGIFEQNSDSITQPLLQGMGTNYSTKMNPRVQMTQNQNPVFNAHPSSYQLPPVNLNPNPSKNLPYTRSMVQQRQQQFGNHSPLNPPINNGGEPSMSQKPRLSNSELGETKNLGTFPNGFNDIKQILSEHNHPEALVPPPTTPSTSENLQGPPVPIRASNSNSLSPNPNPQHLSADQSASPKNSSRQPSPNATLLSQKPPVASLRQTSAQHQQNQLKQENQKRKEDLLSQLTATLEATYNDDSYTRQNPSSSSIHRPNNPNNNSYASQKSSQSSSDRFSTTNTTANFTVSKSTYPRTYVPDVTIPPHSELSRPSNPLQKTPSYSTQPDSSSLLEEPTVLEEVRARVDWRGKLLICPQSGVELRIPECAILPHGREQEVFVKICRATPPNRPPLDPRNEQLISPLVMCGPTGLRFAAPVELRLPQNAALASEIQELAESSSSSLVLRAGPSSTTTSKGGGWRNIELLRAPTKIGPKNGQNEKEENNNTFVSVLVSHF